VLHLKGRFVDEQGGAIAYYQRARPRDRDVLAGEQKHVQTLYEEKLEQAKEQLGDKLTPELKERIKERAAMFVSFEILAIRRGKLDASYWLGLIAYDQAQYPSALDYFNVRVLPLDRELAWAAGAHYNAARSLEAGGQRAKAIREYESSGGAGNLVRAAWLRELDGGKNKNKTGDEGKPEEEKIGEKKMDDK
jgi:tetratricopeptide (TPR) repeat protein